MIAAMAAGAAAAAAYTAVKPPENVVQDRAGRREDPDRRRGDHHPARHAADRGAAGRRRRRAHRRAGQGCRVRAGARRARGPAAASAVRDADQGIYTSGFGYRWGALHAGIDLAGPIGTPIYAVSDGVVTDAGPTAGFGAWVKIRHSDGSVSLYGHVNTWLVQVGQRVFAGDQIATIGNRGDSTGPHLHFSILQNGTNFIDPAPWLAARGIKLGPTPADPVTAPNDPRSTPNIIRRQPSGPFRSPRPMTPGPASSVAHPPVPHRWRPNPAPHTSPPGRRGCSDRPDQSRQAGVGSGPVRPRRPVDGPHPRWRPVRSASSAAGPPRWWRPI